MMKVNDSYNKVKLRTEDLTYIRALVLPVVEKTVERDAGRLSSCNQDVLDDIRLCLSFLKSEIDTAVAPELREKAARCFADYLAYKLDEMADYCEHPEVSVRYEMDDSNRRIITCVYF